MKESIIYLVIIMVMYCMAFEESFAQNESIYAKYISAVDIANVTGITGLKLL